MHNLEPNSFKTTKKTVLKLTVLSFVVTNICLLIGITLEERPRGRSAKDLPSSLLLLREGFPTLVEKVEEGAAEPEGAFNITQPVAPLP